jgi:hypothetical protein
VRGRAEGEFEPSVVGRMWPGLLLPAGLLLLGLLAAQEAKWALRLNRLMSASITASTA